MSYSGILSIIDCVQNIPSTFIHLAVTKVVAVFIVDLTVIVSDGVHLFLITLDKQFSKIVKQVVTPLKGTFSNLFKLLLEVNLKFPPFRSSLDT